MTTYNVILDPRKSFDVAVGVSIEPYLADLAANPLNADGSVTIAAGPNVNVTIPSANILAIVELTAWRTTTKSRSTYAVESRRTAFASAPNSSPT